MVSSQQVGLPKCNTTYPYTLLLMTIWNFKWVCYTWIGSIGNGGNNISGNDVHCLEPIYETQLCSLWNKHSFFETTDQAMLNKYSQRLYRGLLEIGNMHRGNDILFFQRMFYQCPKEGD